LARIAPDVPELEHLPDPTRSIVYMRALHRAIRSPLTWLIGGIVFASAVSVGANQGSALAGRTGAALGMIAGATAAVLGFFKAILPWRTRRLLPSVLQESAGPDRPPSTKT